MPKIKLTYVIEIIIQLQNTGLGNTDKPVYRKKMEQKSLAEHLENANKRIMRELENHN